jgi:hypothetical protein
MRAFVFFASAALLVLGCGKTQNLGGGNGPDGYDPCAGKSCGDACTLCAPGDADCIETAVIKACDAGGVCGVAQSDQCGWQCTYGGATHQAGESFPSEDGCNTCSCLEDGSVACTEIACASECGGIAGIPCAAGEYCNYPGGTCGAGDDLGSCETIPQACDAIFDPVCGCDDITYGNACEAAVAGVSVVHAGACDALACGGLGGETCAVGAYCRNPDGTCDVDDQGGTCEPIPQGCPDNVDPVCGCDGVTYFNACEAAAVGVSLDHLGACEGPNPILCDGLGGTPCDPGQYCKHADGTCAIEDGQGICQAVPVACDDVFDPVCGCDAVTYANACEAAAVSMSIDHAGQCP